MYIPTVVLEAVQLLAEQVHLGLQVEYHLVKILQLLVHLSVEDVGRIHPVGHVLDAPLKLDHALLQHNQLGVEVVTSDLATLALDQPDLQLHLGALLLLDPGRTVTLVLELTQIWSSSRLFATGKESSSS